MFSAAKKRSLKVVAGLIVLMYVMAAAAYGSGDAKAALYIVIMATFVALFTLAVNYALYKRLADPHSPRAPR